MTAIAPTMQAFFTDRLMNQLHASPHTIASYRDTMRLLLAFARQRHGKEPSELDFTHLDAPTVGAFLTLWGAKTALAASDLQLPEAAGGSTGREAGLRSMRGTR